MAQQTSSTPASPTAPSQHPSEYVYFPVRTFPSHSDGVPKPLMEHMQRAGETFRARYEVTQFSHVLKRCHAVPAADGAGFLQHFHLVAQQLDGISRDPVVADCFMAVTGCSLAELRILAMQYLFVLREWAYILRREDTAYLGLLNDVFLNRLVVYRHWDLSVPGNKRFEWGDYPEFQSANEKLCAWVDIPWYEPDGE